jgi:putative NADH-flavin reductase
MELLVVGATGRTGREIVTAALAEGHGVRAFARSAASTTWPEGVVPIGGDVLDRDAVEAAMDGVDGVVVAISMVRSSNWPWAPILTPLDLHTRAAHVLTEVAAQQGVARYVTVSAHGVGDARDRAGRWFLRLVDHSNIGVAYAELGRAEEIVAQTGLDWTIVRPTRLTNRPRGASWEASTTLRTGDFDAISRGDLAAFLVQEATRTAHLHCRVSVTGRG